MCQQSKHHTPEQKSDTPPASSLTDPLLNTLPSISGFAHTLLTVVISHLLASSHHLGASASLKRPVHLLRSLFLHVYPRLPAYSHVALLTQRCHTHLIRRAPLPSDRCCSLGCVCVWEREAFPPAKQLFILANHLTAALRSQLLHLPNV